ncbi:MAG TPA: flagellar basal body rod protein FlgC [Planctomycetaceae bacterium]|jgi:flagellar basal-body rod protein FlgC|nr:flagellar basal body rod protein FlgC [Planctomycetaceae bacterium]
MFNPIDVSTSALVAERQRMNTIADNLANVDTTRNAEGQPSPFQRRFVTFAAAESNGSGAGSPGVTYQVNVDTTTPPRRVYQPGHPDADKLGYVSFPSIDFTTEFVNAMDASRAYQANIVAIDMTKQIDNLSLKILA